jgi:hypothetical protein
LDVVISSASRLDDFEVLKATEPSGVIILNRVNFDSNFDINALSSSGFAYRHVVRKTLIAWIWLQDPV